MNRTTAIGVAALATTALLGGTAPAATAAPAAPKPTPVDALRAAQAQAPGLADALGLGGREVLLARDAIVDTDGSTHLRYDRSYAGLRVIGGDLVVHQTKSGTVRQVSKASPATLSLGTTPTIPASKAASQARTSRHDASWTSASPELIVWATSAEPVLAWDTVLTGVKADQTPSKLHVVTDARTGKALSSWDSIRSLTGNKTVTRAARPAAAGPVVGVAGTGRSFYSGTVPLSTTQSGATYQLKDPLRGNQTVNDLNHGTGAGTLYTDADNVWGDGTVGNTQTSAVDAAYGAAQTWDYYKNVHGRNGIKNNGVGALSKVHYGNAYVNAFWDDAAFSISYGDGAGNTHPLTALDVAGHEFSHGVTSATANLVYSGESGGLNEATSDIFGTSVEFNANNASDVGDYLIGEKIDIFGNGNPLRYQDKPNRDGTSPDAWYSGIGNIDVHYSSGPANHFFYLLSEGSGAKVINGVSYNSPTANGVTLAGIGRAKAEKIWFRALSVYFNSTTNYAGARTGTLSAAADLYGAGSPEHAAVASAWTGVNVAAPPTPPTGKSFENTADVAIPDNGAAVTSAIAVTGVTGNAPSNVLVTVNIVHTYIGDLVVDLIAPDGSVYNVHNRTGGSADNLNQAFFVNASSEVANGSWKLRVQDKANIDTGYVNSWKIQF